MARPSKHAMPIGLAGQPIGRWSLSHGFTGRMLETPSGPPAVELRPTRVQCEWAMRTLLQWLADCLWPVRPKAPAAAVDLDIYLRPLVVLMIVLLCGPEVFAAADLVVLVDLLGAMLFLTAFAVGYRVLGVAALEWTKRLLFPDAWAVFVKTRGHPSTVAHGLALVGANALRVSVVCVAVVVGVLEVVRRAS